MEKLAGDRQIGDLLDLDRPIAETVKLIAERRGTPVGDVLAVVLDRPRHEEGIRAIREAGARVRLITDGDVSAVLLAVDEASPVDFLWGVGGTPEGVISAAAIKSLGGALIGRLAPREGTDERERALELGYDLDKQMTADDLITSERLLLQRHRCDRRRRPAGRPLPGDGGDDRVADHALTVGHVAPRHRASRPREAARGDGGAVRLTALSITFSVSGSGTPYSAQIRRSTASAYSRPVASSSSMCRCSCSTSAARRPVPR